jgi:hypothetical protein
LEENARPDLSVEALGTGEELAPKRRPRVGDPHEHTVGLSQLAAVLELPYAVEVE